MFFAQYVLTELLYFAPVKPRSFYGRFCTKKPVNKFTKMCNKRNILILMSIAAHLNMAQ